MKKPLEKPITRPNIFLIVEGGIIGTVLTDRPCDVTVIDYDTDGMDEDALLAMPQCYGKRTDKAFVFNLAPEVQSNWHERLLCAIRSLSKLTTPIKKNRHESHRINQSRNP